MKDVRMMDEMGLAGGGRLSNLVLLDEEKVVNPPLGSLTSLCATRSST